MLLAHAVAVEGGEEADCISRGGGLLGESEDEGGDGFIGEEVLNVQDVVHVVVDELRLVVRYHGYGHVQRAGQ